MSKAKQHFCKHQIDDKICGDINPENFEKGRYSICKSCKKSISRNINNAKNKKEKLEKINNIDEIIKKGDLKDIILRVPLINENTIKESIEGVIRNMNDQRIQYNESINIMNFAIASFQDSLNKLQKKYDDLKKNNDETMKYCVEMRNYIVQMNDSKSGPFIPKESITDSFFK
jgi:hypothetical protein